MKYRISALSKQVPDFVKIFFPLRCFRIEPREAHFRIEEINPREALLGEIATVPLTLICEETSPIQNIRYVFNDFYLRDAQNLN